MKKISQMMLLLSVCLLASRLDKAQTLTPEPTETFKNKLVLVEPDQYLLYWNFNQTDITFEIQVKNVTWAAFGLSPNGGMRGSDVIVTINRPDGKNHFSDRHVPVDALFPIVDSKADWFQLYNGVKQGYLISKFTRSINICSNNKQQEVEDLDVVPGTPYVIYAYGNELNSQARDIMYHGPNRGSKTVPLISSLNEKVNLDMKKIEMVDFRVNASIINGHHTEYFCQMFKLPKRWLDKKRHVLRYETLITPGNENLVHHWTANECVGDIEGAYINKMGMPEPGPCYSMHESQPTTYWNDIRRYCTRVSYVWAVGGSLIQDFPSDIAYPVGGDDGDFTYFFLEMHYDNPEFKKDLKDQSGFRVYATTEYRPIEFGIFYTAALEHWLGIMIPPQIENFKMDFFCRSDCLDQVTDSNGGEINVFATMPHAHLKGREVYSQIIRDGKDAEYLSNNKYFDFNYQYYNFLTNPVKLRKGDQIRTTCVFDSKNDKNFTFGGLATTNEMCESFVWYYPRNKNFQTCYEFIEPTEIVDFLGSLEKAQEIELKNNLTEIMKEEGLTKQPDIVYKGKRNLKNDFNEFMAKSNRTQICFTKNGVQAKNQLKKIDSLPIQKNKCQ